MRDITISPSEERRETLEKLAFYEIRALIEDVEKLLRKAGFKPDQPRVPAGSSDGGQWTDGSGSGGGITSSNKVSAKKPSVIEHSDKRVSVNRSDGITETRNGGSRSWRNNNPGNLRAGKFANSHGAVGSAGGFAVFPDEATGQSASKALLRSKGYSNLTVDQAIAKRSPSNENDTARTQNLIRQFSGLSGKEKISTLTDNQLDSLTSAIKRSEGWYPGSISQSYTR